MSKSIQVGTHWVWPAVLVAAGAALASCAVGPDYQRPKVAVPGAFKHAAEPETKEPALVDSWWTLFGDPVLTKLAEETVAANLDIRAAMARVEQARQSRLSALGDFSPALSVNATARRARTVSGSGGGLSGQSTTTGTSTAGSGLTVVTANQYSLPLDLTYEIDAWGRLRRQYEYFKDTEIASAEDLVLVRQTAVAELAQAYFTIRLYDRQIAVYEEALKLYRQQLTLTDTKYKAGLALQTDVLQARTQVNSATSQVIEVKRSRVKQEHAIALLLGRAPEDFSFAPAPLDNAIPTVPAGLPVNLLERRPDVAEAEHRLAAANAQIGMAKADFFPTFTLSASGGFQSTNSVNLLNWERRVWSIGPALNLPIFQGGKLTAALAQAKARYEELMANYRTAVLGAFRDVEDQLADLHLLAEKAEALEETLVSARENSRLTELQYRQGLTTYLQVIDANQTQLTNELVAAQAQSQRLAATVLLIKALGGGWQPTEPDSLAKH